MKSTPLMEKKLKESVSKGILVPRTENNPYLKCSYKGNGTPISDKWNVKIYTSGSVVCNDEKILQDLIEDSFKEPNGNLRVIQIDDAGWGFPLCGIMIGITDGTEVWTDIVNVSFFRGSLYEEKHYLQEYANKGIKLLEKNGIAPATHRIEICTGFVNTYLRDVLRGMGYDVCVAEIKGLLQDRLERLFQQYVKKEIGRDLAYDPKKMKKEDIGKSYYQVLDWSKRNAPHLLKSGWKSMKGDL